MKTEASGFSSACAADLFPEVPARSYFDTSTYTGNAIHARLRGHEHEPAPFIFHEIQEIVLTVDFKLQFLFSLQLETTRIE